MKLKTKVFGWLSAPRTRNMYWRTKQRQFKKENKTIEKGGIVLLGDSITDCFNINEWYKGESIINRGISGDTTAGVLLRMKECVFDTKPRKIFILIGTNDIARDNYSEKTTAENISAIINVIKEKSPQTKIYVQSVYPVNGSIKTANISTRTNAKINSLNNRIIKTVDDLNAEYLKVNEVLADSKGELKANITEDGLHLNDAGYDIVFEYLFPYIK